MSQSLNRGPINMHQSLLGTLAGSAVKLSVNAPKAYLMNQSIRQGQGRLGPHGELLIQTGKHTGRSANDKYVVKTKGTENSVWWENNLHMMSESAFDTLFSDVLDYLKLQPELFATTRSIGHDQHFGLNIETITEMPSAAMFTDYMFKGPLEKPQGHFGILHAPYFKANPEKYGAKSPTIVVTCFERQWTIIVGTLYAGEIKKSMFSIMNFLTPAQGILPMHSGASQNQQGQSFVFFGLSGTGKTTLSTDEGMLLIGDDEHGLSEKGLFNFEGGCYAKTFKLSSETEPAIFKASTRWASFLENVGYDESTGTLDFNDDSVTENGRSSYPLDFISDKVADGTGPIPRALFFLTADAFGVLPPLAKLSTELAMQYFKLGYTAKLAGTEIGVKAPKATFSTCFGAPFMLRRPSEYAELLARYIQKFNLQVYLVNTGWTGGEYGVGQRFPLKVTRQLIRAVQSGQLEKATYVRDPIFGFDIPSAVEGVDSSLLYPRQTWSDKDAYVRKAQELQSSFEEQLKKMDA